MQLVNLVEGGERARMSKRRGDFATLDELLDDIGVDAARFFMLQRSHDTAARHRPRARARAVLRQPRLLRPVRPCPDLQPLPRGRRARPATRPAEPAAPRRPLEPAERALIARLLELPDQVAERRPSASRTRSPPTSREVAADFHAFYRDCRVVGAGPGTGGSPAGGLRRQPGRDRHLPRPARHRGAGGDVSRGDGSRAAIQGLRTLALDRRRRSARDGARIRLGDRGRAHLPRDSTVVVAPVDGEGADPDAARAVRRDRRQPGGRHRGRGAARGRRPRCRPARRRRGPWRPPTASPLERRLARADQPDFAVAAADGYAEALDRSELRDAGRRRRGATADRRRRPPRCRAARARTAPRSLCALVGLGAGLVLASSARVRPAAALARRRSARGAGGGVTGRRRRPRSADPGFARRPERRAAHDRAGSARARGPGGRAAARGGRGSRPARAPDAPKVVAIVPVERGRSTGACRDGARRRCRRTGAAGPARRGGRWDAGGRGVDGSPRGTGPRRLPRWPRRAARGAPEPARRERDGVEPFPLVCVPGGDRGGSEPDDLAGARMQALAERLPRVYDLVLLLESPLAAVPGPADAPGVRRRGGARQLGGRCPAVLRWSAGSTAGEVPVLGQVLIGE